MDMKDLFDLDGACLGLAGLCKNLIGLAGAFLGFAGLVAFATAWPELSGTKTMIGKVSKMRK